MIYFNNSLPYCTLNKENEYRLDILKRVATASIPIVSLYKPLGKSISISYNGYHFIKNIFETFQNPLIDSSSKKNFFSIAYRGIALTSSIYKFSLTESIIILSNVVQHVTQISQFYGVQEYACIIENLLKTGIDSLSLFLLIHSSLEIMLALAILQMSLAIFQAYREGIKNRYIEVGAQTILSLLYAQTIVDQYNSILHRNELFQKYNKLVQDMLLGQKLKNQRHSLCNLQDSFIKNRILLQDSSGKEYDLGAHFHGFGKQFVKGNNLSIKEIELSNEKYFQLEFKINQVFRDRLQERIETLKEINETDIQSLFSYLGYEPNNLIKVKHSREPTKGFPQFKTIPNPITTVVANELGIITLGINDKYHNLKDKVIIHVKADKGIQDCIDLAALISLPEVLSVSSEKDIERLKIGHLFRNSFPKEATRLERSMEFYDLAIDELKDRIITICPQMKTIFNQYLPKMSPEIVLSKNTHSLDDSSFSQWNIKDIIKQYFFHTDSVKVIPGKVRYKINGLSQEIYNAGGRALMAGVTSGKRNKDTSYSRIASMLKMGMLSTELRDSIQLYSNGLSPEVDWSKGGADSVYTQLITEKSFGNDFGDITVYKSDIRLLIDLEALELGSYQYPVGMSGTRTDDEVYLSRDNIISTTEHIMGNNRFKHITPNMIFEMIMGDDPPLKDIIDAVAALSKYRSHEIMLKDTINPKFFRGIIVPNKLVYEELTSYLRGVGLITQDTNGNDFLLNQPTSSFIRVGEQITKELVA